MKKSLLLILVSLFVCLHAAAIGMTTNLNPFAYNLSATLSADQSELTIKYCLNADVTSLKIVIEGEGQTITHNVTEASKLKKTVADKPYFSPYEVSFSTDGLGAGTFTWRIEVTGAGRNEIQVYSQDGTNAHTYPFYLPSSVDIVKDTRSFNYGKVIVVEGSHSGKGNANFHSNEIGAGLYVFNPDFTPILNRNNKPGFNGGSATWNSTSNTYFANIGDFPLRRIRVSKDGRIFVTSMHEKSNSYVNGHVLWEVDPYFGKWTTVMGKGIGGATYDYNTYQLKTASGTYIAGPGAALDVKGEGDELTLLMLSCDKSAFSYINSSYFHTNEYKLGKNTTWSSAPKTVNTGSIFIAPEGSNAQYDGDGGIWCISNRASTSDSYPGWVHITANGTRDVTNKINNQQNAAIRFNNDFSQVIIGGKTSQTQHSYSATIYSVSKDNSGKPIFTETSTIDMSATGRQLNDFAWDPANNIYAVGAYRQIGIDGHVAVYCMPYTSSDIFTTPGPEPFTIDCEEGLEYNVTTTVNDHAMGSATGGGSIQSCELATLTATANDGYRFVNWTVGGNVVSEANPYEFIVTKHIEIQANFAPAVFNGIVWKNLFQKEEDDITKESLDGTLNNRLWRLYQVQFNKYAGNRNDKGINTYSEFDVAGFIGTEARGNSNVGYLTAEETNETYPFAWLGKYIEDVSGTKILNITNESSRRSHLNYIMYMFFNRTDKARNSSAADATYLVQWTDNTKSFKGANGYGMPIKWRPYWTEYACKLPNTLEHDAPMPTTWTKLSCSTDPVKNDAGTIIGTPADWYQWNNPPSESHLLAWRDGSTSGDIVHHVSRDNMELYATYVDRHISESQDNTDVIRLMQNSGYAGTPHALTVDRKLQAGMYNTICFPFTVYINDEGGHSGLAANHPLKGATVLKLTGKDELYDESGEPVVVLNFEQVNKLEAGKPYLIKLADNKSSITEPINFTGVTYDDLTYINGYHSVTIDDATITFNAVISPTQIPEQAIIVVADNRLATLKNTTEPLKGLRGYFTIDDPYLQSIADEGRMYLSIKKPTTTSVPVAPEAEQQTQPKVRKVMQDGKIYIIRGEEIYTISGMRVQ